MIVGGRVTTLKRCRMRPTEPADRVRHVGHDALCEVEVAVALGLSGRSHAEGGAGACPEAPSDHPSVDVSPACGTRTGHPEPAILAIYLRPAVCLRTCTCSMFRAPRSLFQVPKTPCGAHPPWRWSPRWVRRRQGRRLASWVAGGWRRSRAAGRSSPPGGGRSEVVGFSRLLRGSSCMWWLIKIPSC